MEKIIIYPEDEKQSEAVKNFLQGLKIHFECEEYDSKSIGGFQWYGKTESLNSIIHSLIAHYSLEKLNLSNARQTDEYKKHCRDIIKELKAVNSNFPIWDSLELMKENIDKYGALLRKVHATI